ncbi:30S ribosomal protein S7 [Candidatus Nomurabacteria bacterium]|nr:30S ribosomal protein S7 [Candidatus Nomurabacteria bacterium]MCB9820865.1 30S ribosomal protein S7 [Candidatus Nomurabacteria bacterium]
MRRPIKNKNKVKADRVYQSEKLAKFMNYVMLHGKKVTAERIVYGALDIIKEKMNVENPIEVFDEAIRNASPSIEVRSRRIGGANYQVPVDVRPERKIALTYRWIIDSARSRSGNSMAERLAEELMLAAKGEGNAVKKKEDTHRMAEANKAFAHFAW